MEKKIINQKKLFLIFGFIIFIIFLDIYKYKEYYFSINHFHIWDTKNTLSFLDIFFIDEFFKIYSSFYQRILNVWMMGILDETNYGINPNYDLLNFLFGTYRKEYFVHDSLYFHIFYEFGLIGLFLFVFYLFKYVGVLDKKYLILIISILIFSINSEILFVSSTIDIVIIFFLVSYYKLSNIKTVKI